MRLVGCVKGRLANITRSIAGVFTVGGMSYLLVKYVLPEGVVANLMILGLAMAAQHERAKIECKRIMLEVFHKEPPLAEKS